MHICETVYKISGTNQVYGNVPGICKITGKESTGLLFEDWVKDGFTEFGNLKPGTIISNEALFCFDEQSLILAKKTNKFFGTKEDVYKNNELKILAWQKKNKTSELPPPEKIGYIKTTDGYACLQRFRTYSHIIKGQDWYCLTKADKEQIFNLICAGAEIVSITETGQKHIFFKHRPGMWQLDDLFITPNIPEFIKIHTLLCDMMRLGFSQSEAIIGNYIQNRVELSGLQKWKLIEDELKKYRGTALFTFASWMLFISEKDKEAVQEMYKKKKDKKHGKINTRDCGGQTSLGFMA